MYVGGKKQLRTVAGARSGDRGDFRLFGLRAGTYYLKATGRQVAPFELIDKATVTYYPGTADRAAPRPSNCAPAPKRAALTYGFSRAARTPSDSNPPRHQTLSAAFASVQQPGFPSN